MYKANISAKHSSAFEKLTFGHSFRRKFPSVHQGHRILSVDAISLSGEALDRVKRVASVRTDTGIACTHLEIRSSSSLRSCNRRDGTVGVLNGILSILGTIRFQLRNIDQNLSVFYMFREGRGENAEKRSNDPVPILMETREVLLNTAVYIEFSILGILMYFSWLSTPNFRGFFFVSGIGLFGK